VRLREEKVVVERHPQSPRDGGRSTGF
jgi:hypothetical protein